MPTQKTALTAVAFVAGIFLTLALDSDDQRRVLFTSVSVLAAVLYLVQTDGARPGLFHPNLLTAGALAGVAFPHAFTGMRLGITAYDDTPSVLGGLFATLAVGAFACAALAIRRPPSAPHSRQPLPRAR